MSSALQCTTTEIVCDRCAQQASHEELDFQEYTSIEYVAGYGSVFGDGSTVQLDLCQCCVQQLLGAWLRVNEVNAKPKPLTTSGFQDATSK